MSAEVLRRATTRIRHDIEFGQAHGADDFLLAVADWLEAVAIKADAVEAAGLTFGGFEGRPALAVARAYLGETS
jgi:hypothetical protein